MPPRFSLYTDLTLGVNAPSVLEKQKVCSKPLTNWQNLFSVSGGRIMEWNLSSTIGGCVSKSERFIFPHTFFFFIFIMVLLYYA
jgi:hypothetical protein